MTGVTQGTAGERDLHMPYAWAEHLIIVIDQVLFFVRMTHIHERAGDGE